MDLSHCFDVEEDSDLVLHLITNTGDPQPLKRQRLRRGPVPKSTPARSFFLMKGVLKQSSVFKTMLQGCGYADDASVLVHSAAITVSRAELTQLLPMRGFAPTMHESDLEAMHIMLRSLYNALVHERISYDQLLLLKACRLARFYCLPDYCIAAITAPLQAMKPEEVGLAVLAAVYSPAAGLLDCDALSKFLATCKERLLSLFGDVPAVLVSKEAREQFCLLPHAAVLAWLKEDNLKVHSENCVMLLLSVWVNGQGHHTCREELEELAHHVRVQHLSPSYLHAVLPYLWWFKDCGCMASLMPLLLRKRCQGSIASSLVWKGPPAWLSAARGRTSLPQSMQVSFDFKAAELQDKDWPRSAPPPGYLNGFFLGVQVWAIPSTSGPEAVTLGGCAGISVGAMEEALGSWDPTKQAAEVSSPLGWKSGACCMNAQSC